MTKHMFAHAALLSIVVCSFAQPANSQPPQPPSGGELLSDPFLQPATTSYPGAGSEFILDGVSLTASRVRSYTVSVSTLQIQPLNRVGGMGDGPGGMDSGRDSGMGMDSSMGEMSDMRVVIAFIMDHEQIAGRTRIEVIAPQGSQGNYVRLEALSAARPSKSKTEKKASLVWSPATAKLIKDTISLKIWKEDAIKTLKAEEGKGEQAAASEKLLKAVLSEEYDAQLARQQFELARLQERLTRIHEEFTRRQQAKDRVIDVQLGKIILEAQGILGDNQ